MRRVLELRQEILPGSVETAIAWNNLGVSNLKFGRRAEARLALQSALEIFVEHFGADHWQVGNTLFNLGYLHELEGRYDEALLCVERSLTLEGSARSVDHIKAGVLNSQRAQILAKLGRHAEALSAAEQGVEILRQAAPDPIKPLASARLRQGRVLLAAGSVSEAEARLESWPLADPFELRLLRAALAKLSVREPS